MHDVLLHPQKPRATGSANSSFAGQQPQHGATTGGGVKAKHFNGGCESRGATSKNIEASSELRVPDTRSIYGPRIEQNRAKYSSASPQAVPREDKAKTFHGQR